MAFRVVSPIDERYNCVAWALQINDRWMWPRYGYAWFREPSAPTVLQEFEEVFELLGYEPCQSHLWEPGFEKLALYTADGEPEHVAYQRADDGVWISKLGRGQDVEHDNLRDLPLGKPFFCENFGNPTHFYRRCLPQEIVHLVIGS